MDIPIFKKTQFCIIENVKTTLDIFKKELARFIKTKLIKNEKK